MDQALALLNQIMDFFKSFGSMPLQGKIAGIVLSLITVWKSSMLRPYWDKWGEWKLLVAPLLGILLGLTAIQPFSTATVWAGFMGGVLALPLHDFLSALEEMPWIGPTYKTLIGFLEKILKKPQPPVVDPPAPAPTPPVA